jgi:hypothetical protein
MNDQVVKDGEPGMKTQRNRIRRFVTYSRLSRMKGVTDICSAHQSNIVQLNRIRFGTFYLVKGRAHRNLGCVHQLSPKEGIFGMGFADRPVHRKVLSEVDSASTLDCLSTHPCTPIK